MLGSWDVAWEQEHGAAAYRDVDRSFRSPSFTSGHGKVLWLSVLPGGGKDDRVLDHFYAALAERPSGRGRVPRHPVGVAGARRRIAAASWATGRLRQLDGWHLCQDGAAAVTHAALETPRPRHPGLGDRARGAPTRATNPRTKAARWPSHPASVRVRYPAHQHVREAPRSARVTALATDRPREVHAVGRAHDDRTAVTTDRFGLERQAGARARNPSGESTAFASRYTTPGLSRPGRASRSAARSRHRSTPRSSSRAAPRRTPRVPAARAAVMTRCVSLPVQRDERGADPAAVPRGRACTG